MTYVIKPVYAIEDNELINKISEENGISWNSACDVWSSYAPMDGEGYVSFSKNEIIDFPIEILTVLEKYFNVNGISSLKVFLT